MFKKYNNKWFVEEKENWKKRKKIGWKPRSAPADRAAARNRSWHPYFGCCCVHIRVERLKTGVSKTGEGESFPKRGKPYLF